MNLHHIDWAVIFSVVMFFIISAYTTKKYTQSTADFLAANRCAGRYLLTLAEGISGIGAITVVALWQMYYKVGFVGTWWANLSIPVTMLMMLTGWVIYRYRETRVMTMAQFFEIRYSRNFRIFAGVICWISGILNFGIFPAVGANFFINYCGLPEHYRFGILTLPTYQTLIVALVGISLYFTFIGGQISVLITDFFQSFFCNFVFVTILALLLIKFPLKNVFDTLLIAEEGKSLVNPFDSGQSDFNPWYFIIAIVGYVFNRLSWQGSQAYNCSAKSPHEAKMAGVLAGFRSWGFMYALILVPIVGYMIMHHPNYTAQAEQVSQMINSIENEQVRDQMVVPMTMTLYMPVGLMGAFVAVMLAAFVSTNDTYLHSWGSIFIQDIVVPLRKKSFTTKQHIWALRLSIIFVAIFVCIFSIFFRQTQHILYFFALTGAIWLGGIGAVIIGGLYTRWGNTAGAYAAVITGSVLATGGMICEQLYKDWYDSSLFIRVQYVYIYFIILGFAGSIIAGRVAGLKWGKIIGIFIGLISFILIFVTVFLLETKKVPWALFNLPWPENRFVLNGQWVYFFSMITSITVYIVFSFFGGRINFNLDKMLHRGQYRISIKQVGKETGEPIRKKRKFSFKKAIGITEDFTLGDKIIYGITIIKSLVLFLLFSIMTVFSIFRGLSDKNWSDFHYYIFWIMSGTSFFIAIWLFIGGICNIISLFKDLKTAKRDFADDGSIH